MNTGTLSGNKYAHQVVNNADNGLNIIYYKNEHGMGQFSLVNLNIHSIKK